MVKAQDVNDTKTWRMNMIWRLELVMRGNSACLDYPELSGSKNEDANFQFMGTKAPCRQ